jgi:membrane protein YqaA with SNARE-associated domain
MKSPLRRLYDWSLKISAHKHADRYLAAIAFIESSVFPIPPDAVLIPMCIANRKKSFYYATICTVASVVGGLLGYYIGYGLYETIGKKVIEIYGMTDQFAALQAKYAVWGGWIIFAKGMTPIPYKILTILSGALHLALPVFIVASICSRAIRFFLVAGLLWKFGAPIQTFIEKRLALVTTIFLLLVIGGFVAIKYLL